MIYTFYTRQAAGRPAATHCELNVDSLNAVELK